MKNIQLLLGPFDFLSAFFAQVCTYLQKKFAPNHHSTVATTEKISAQTYPADIAIARYRVATLCAFALRYNPP